MTCLLGEHPKEEMLCQPQEESANANHTFYKFQFHTSVFQMERKEGKDRGGNNREKKCFGGF